MATGEWCLIESDPGVFTDLIHGFGRSNFRWGKMFLWWSISGADGVQVEEIFSLDDDSLEQMKYDFSIDYLENWII
jgi:ubiquitin carboxyl-terminal hydrolase L5